MKSSKPTSRHVSEMTPAERAAGLADIERREREFQERQIRPPEFPRSPSHPRAARASPEAELHDLLRHWSLKAAQRGVSDEAIRTVHIASDLGEEGWPPDADAPQLTAAAWFEPCTEMRCVAFARYCLEHYAERESLLWRYRREELRRLHDLAELAEALAPEVEEARKTRPEVLAVRKVRLAQSKAGQRGRDTVKKENAKAVDEEWMRYGKLSVPIPEKNRVSKIVKKLGLSEPTVRRHLDALGRLPINKRT